MGSPEYNTSRPNPLANHTAWEVAESVRKGLAAGYYRIVPKEDRVSEEVIPFINKRCGDCIFSQNTVCRIRAEVVDQEKTTCRFFDTSNHAEGAKIIYEQYLRNQLNFLKWMNRGNEGGETGSPT